MSHRPFIETQFPLARLSIESYKERKAGSGQTLTGLGKWWGRKPLILVRASILGLLMPASDDPAKDREIFYKILTMDEDGLWKRKNKKLTAKEIISILGQGACGSLIDVDSGRWNRGLTDEDKGRLNARPLLGFHMRTNARSALDPRKWMVPRRLGGRSLTHT